MKLTPITPRTGFAIGEKFPTLNQKLEMDWMWVPSLQSCDFEGERCFPIVWWNGSKRGACLIVPGSLASARCWVGFACEGPEAA